MKNYIKPCPFCGKDLVKYENPGGKGLHDFHYTYYTCPTIGCISSGIRVTSENIKFWQRRALD